MFNRILLPLDGSTLSERAIAHAEQFARIFKASIYLLRVLEPPAYYEQPLAIDPGNWQIRKAEAEAYLSGIAAQIRTNLGEDSSNARYNNRVRYFILDGKTAENIVDFAHTEDIDLLIISTHGSGGLSHWNIGSVVQKVIHLIYLPVLIVRANIDPAVKSMLPYHRILLPIDGSRRAEFALSAGIALASSLENTEASNQASAETTKLILAEVIKPPEVPISRPFPEEIASLFDQFMRFNRNLVRCYLNELKNRLPAVSEIRIVENDNIFFAIHEIVEQDDIDLVILSAHGSTAQFNWPYGKVTRHYIEHGEKTLLILQDMPRSLARPNTAQITVTNLAGIRYMDRSEKTENLIH